MCDDIERYYLVGVAIISVVYGIGVLLWDYRFHLKTENKYLSVFPSLSPFFSLFFLILGALTFYVYVNVQEDCDLGGYCTSLQFWRLFGTYLALL